MTPVRTEPSLATKLAFLRRPQSYPEQPASVEVIETHLSWVFLTPTRVYKLKKPLRYDYLDFSTLAARRHNCEEEVRLNRMLAPSVYLGVQALCLNAQGCLSLTEAGPAVEYLVVMRRLPESRCLQNQLRQGTVQPAEVTLAAERLVEFYLATPSEEPRSPRELSATLAEQAAELATLLPAQAAAIEALRASLQAWLERHGPLLAQRRRIEAHGDLRPQHVYLGVAPVFIDRLEFSRHLRLLDPLEELAFLALECERLGGAWVGERFLAVYRQRSGDAPPPGLVGFYKAVRALLWALLSARHLNRGGGPEWTARAEHYLQLGQTAPGQG